MNPISNLNLESFPEEVFKASAISVNSPITLRVST